MGIVQGLIRYTICTWYLADLETLDGVLILWQFGYLRKICGKKTVYLHHLGNHYKGFWFRRGIYRLKLSIQVVCKGFGFLVVHRAIPPMRLQ